MSVPKNRAHRQRDARPLFTFRVRATTALRGQGVVLARATRRPVTPHGFEQPITLHLVERRIDSALLELKRAGAAALSFLHDFIAVHLPFDQQAKNRKTPTVPVRNSRSYSIRTP